MKNVGSIEPRSHRSHGDMQLISGIASSLPSGVYSKLSKYRFDVFVGKLGWALDTQGSADSDQFDRPDTVYVVAHDQRGFVTGCARLLPTNRPYLLGEVFPQLLNGLPAPCSEDVWELSRFAAVDLNSELTAHRGQFSSPVAIGLLRESIAYAATQGVKRLVSVSPVGVERLLRKAGVNAHRAGPPVVVNGHAIFACWIEIDGAFNATHQESSLFRNNEPQRISPQSRASLDFR